MIVRNFKENGTSKRIERFNVTKLMPCMGVGYYVCDDKGAGVLSAPYFKGKNVKVGDLVEFTNVQNGSGYWYQMSEKVYLNGKKV